jgi:hypothetical protein
LEVVDECVVYRRTTERAPCPESQSRAAINSPFNCWR